MIALILAAAFTMAQPTHVYEVTWGTAKTESEVLQSLDGMGVLQVKRGGVASKQKKWSCVIQSRDAKSRMRDRLKNLRDVRRVRITE